MSTANTDIFAGLFGDEQPVTAPPAVATNKRSPRSPTATAPFTVVIDTREQAPYSFQGLVTDAAQGSKPLEIPVVFSGLPTGDYSIEGFTNAVCLERKSREDLFSTLGQGRERFEREHERMAAMVAAGGWAAVVIEASLHSLLTAPPAGSRLNPKTVFRTYIAWQQRYRVPWMFADGRRLAELLTYRSLERWWNDLKNPKA